MRWMWGSGPSPECVCVWEAGGDAALQLLEELLNPHVPLVYSLFSRVPLPSNLSFLF